MVSIPNTLRADFVVESREHLQVLENSMLSIENAVGESDVREFIDTSLRAVHSLKGNAGFMGFHTLQSLAHATESVLENYRDSSVAPPRSVVEAILVTNDRLAAMLDDLDHSESLDISSLLLRLKGIVDSSLDNFPVDLEQNTTTAYQVRLPSAPFGILAMLDAIIAIATLRAVDWPKCDLTTSVDSWEDSKIGVELNANSTIFDLHRQISLHNPAMQWSDLGAVDLRTLEYSDSQGILKQFLEQFPQLAGGLFYEPADLATGVPISVVWIANGKSIATIESIPIEQPSPKHIAVHASAESVRAVSKVEPFSIPTPESNFAKVDNNENQDGPVVKQFGTAAAPNLGAERSVSLRINVELLDRLMNLVGELTLVRNQALLAFGELDGTPRAVIQRLNSVTSELQVSVLKTRMQPVGSLFDRFPRMVRDLSRQLGKEIELVTVGQEVELDKTVLEQLSDPLIHLIRNSIDHGLETPRVRLHAGKPRIGKVTLSAKTADGQVVIEVRDDGRGIDPNAIRTKVLALGLKTEAELSKISPKELYSYILLPGFSTAKQVSDVSGRGVGMDVVRTNIERLEGSLTIDSKPGKGTSMVMRVPLTLAIIPCLIVTVGAERFAVPQRGLEEIVCLYPGGQGAIEHAYDTEMYRLREVLLPVVRYAEVLKRTKPFDAAVKCEIMASNKPADRDPKRIEYILVLRTGDRKFGLLVDDVRGTVEVVVKPMHPSLKKIGIFAGATLMGDGCVSLISNIDGVAEHADCFGVETLTKEETLRDAAEVHRVLLFEYGPEEQFAVPLVQVRRIESISMDRVEHVGNQSFITIEGVPTRIVHLDKYLNVSSCDPLPQMHLLLPKFVREPMGILVSRIIDSESLAIEIHEVAVDDPGILGTAIVRGRLALFLDTQYLREKIFGSVADKQVVQKGPSENAEEDALTSTYEPVNGSHRLLLVDDTRFFREVVKRYFEREGLSVVTAVDGLDGMRKLANESFDLVVSDIEMPNMNGWQFCTAARKEGYKTKFLALSSLNKAENESKSKACGFDGFEEKLNHDRLIVTVRKLLGVESEVS